jgi:hypothetical protein
MADIHSPHDNIDVRINSKIQIYGHVLLIGSIFSGSVGIFFLALFTITHFTQAVILSSVYIYGLTGLLFLSLLGLVIGLWVKLVIVPSSKAYATAIEARGQANRNKLIHIQDNAAVIENVRGEIEVVPLLTMQQRDIYHHKPEQQLLEAPNIDPLPTLVHYSDIRHTIPTGHTLVGVGAGNELVTREDGVRALLWIVGGSGTGKTNSVVVRVDDDYTRGHKFLVVDPHANKEDSLANAIAPYADRFLLPVAQKSEAILQVLDTFLTEFDRRKHNPPPYYPLTLIVDEIGSLTMDVDPDEPLEAEIKRKVKEIGRMCGQEGRGFRMYAVMISQDVAYLAWLRKRALLAIIHQVQDYEDRLRATNRDSAISRDMDTWPVGRTFCFGINFQPVVVQQPLVGKRSKRGYREPLSVKNGLDANGDMPGGDFDSIGRSLPTSNLNNGRGMDDRVEEAGRDFDLKTSCADPSTKKLLSEIGKRLKKGERAEILKEFGVKGGRTRQELNAVFDLIEEEEL